MPSTPYAALGDLQNTIQAYALVPVPTVSQSAHLQRAADKMDGYLNTQFKLPLITFATDIIQCNCDLAMWGLMRFRGFNPKAGADKLIRDAYDEAIKWLEGIAADTIHPIVVDSSTGPNPPNRGEGNGFRASVGAPYGGATSQYTRGFVPGNYGPSYPNNGPFGWGG